MKSKIVLFIVLMSFLTFHMLSQETANPYGLTTQVKTKYGTLEGTFDTRTKIASFKGVPFALPPVGSLRWREPMDPKPWSGILQAKKFGPKAIQAPLFGDMGFRSNGMSEDCLYLNVWSPNPKSTAKLPVLVYFYGGGFMAGDGSEPRYDGEMMAQKGIVTVTVNYRLGLLGFFSHPELTKESPHKASGNQGLLDQYASLKWVKENIENFGGDPSRVTIAGESAGSMSVSAQMASPLSKNLIHGAVGESGAWIGSGLGPITLQDAEKTGLTFGEKVGAKSLKELRDFSTLDLYQKMLEPGMPRFSACIDGYFISKTLPEIFANKEQAMVPLLLGWNSEEMNYKSMTKGQAITTENYTAAVKDLYKENADKILALYPGKTVEEAEQSATDLAGDRFIGFSTWKWFDMHRKNSQNPIYRYYFAKPRPEMIVKGVQAALAGGVVKADPNAPKQAAPKGAVHSADIEYFMGNLSTNLTYGWTADDYKTSKDMQDYLANFIKTGNPNGGKLTNWPRAGQEDQPEFMILDANPRIVKGSKDARYELLDSIIFKK